MKLTVPDFSKARILTIGDIILDKYWHGSTSRISPEAPVPVVRICQEEYRPGGAGNVALNLASLGAQADLLGIVGNDNEAIILEDTLQKNNVSCSFCRVNERPTITKLRILSQHQQLIRLDFEDIEQAVDAEPLLSLFTQVLPHADLVIISDYGKGIQQHIPTFIALAKSANIPVLVDPKGNDFTPYCGATLLTPNKKEFEAIVGHCSNEATFLERGLALINTLNLEALLVTRGEQGMTLIQPKQPELHIPACKREVFDVTGAGDTVIATLAASLGAGEDLATAVVLSNIAAGIAVSKLGAAAVTAPELRREVWQSQSIGRGLMNEEELLLAVQDAKAHGERIVMTNGCFDILHAGHVAYLEQAKMLGDRLIVAINTDESIKKLKGKARPINKLAERIAVLTALNAVDWVIPFAEDTPRKLISILQPDVLVKGGDYRIEEVVGHEIVQGYGGTVEVLTHIENCSTTDIIEKARSA